jgi:5-methylcytosine-specific restriction endonuclease McrA
LKPDPRPEKRRRDPDLLRQLHLELVNEPCDRCGLRAGVQLHHKRFRSQAGDDARNNLEWLCAPCHDEAHGL